MERARALVGRASVRKWRNNEGQKSDLELERLWFWEHRPNDWSQAKR